MDLTFGFLQFRCTIHWAQQQTFHWSLQLEVKSAFVAVLRFLVIAFLITFFLIRVAYFPTQDECLLLFWRACKHSSFRVKHLLIRLEKLLTVHLNYLLSFNAENCFANVVDFDFGRASGGSWVINSFKGECSFFFLQYTFFSFLDR